MRRPRTRRNRDRQDLRDPQNRTLKAKVEHLKGICAREFSDHHVRDKTIAHALGVAAEVWSRMKSGRVTPDSRRLGLLASHFELGKYCLAHDVFFLATLGDFQAVMQRKGVGLYGRGHPDVIRRRLLAAKNRRGDGLDIQQAMVRAGGVSGTEPELDVGATFCVGDSVTVRISHPEGGHLLVLNDAPDGKIDCVMPSCFAPRTETRGRQTQIPTDRSHLPVIPILGPSEMPYMLYAIWTREPLSLAFVQDVSRPRGEPRCISLDEFWQVVEQIEAFDRAGAASPAYELRHTSYKVVARNGECARPGVGFCRDTNDTIPGIR
jgi:hypothetical protein